MAASEAAKEAKYLRMLFTELGVDVGQATKLYVDNQGAIDLSYNPEHHQRSKHIDRRHFFVRELVESGELVVPFVNSADNIADLFTKPLPASKFYPLRNKVMNVPEQSSQLSSMGSRMGG